MPQRLSRLRCAVATSRDERRRRLSCTATLLYALALAALLTAGCQKPPDTTPPRRANPAQPHRTFQVRGVVEAIEDQGKSLVVQHETIPDYMEAMTMPFRVKDPALSATVKPGDEISFRLNVTDDESWIDQLKPTGRRLQLPAPQPASSVSPAQTPAARHPLMDFPFTNELNQPVRLSDFRGRALAITFFFTRCPIPDYCPRLTKNFEEATRKLSRMPGAPTNWHFLSVTIDPEFDTPQVLKAYGQRYQYDAAHWSFVTGPTQEIAALAAQSGVQIKRDAGLPTHNFSTLITDPAGKLRMNFPTGGNLANDIVTEILKAAQSTNASAP